MKDRLILGIDEAGRGPVIGSLFVAGALFNEEDLDKLKELGVKDSKLLAHKKRIELSKKIIKIARDWKIIKVTPQEIDNAVDSDSKDMNLNWLEAHKQAELINSLKPDVAIIDCPSPNIKKFTEFLKNLLEVECELIVEHKADLNFLPVAAASILAKCSREDEVEELKKKYGNIGPGYTSNEITQKFIKENWEKHPEIIRHSWSTIKNHKNAKIQKSLDEF